MQRARARAKVYVADSVAAGNFFGPAKTNEVVNALHHMSQRFLDALAKAGCNLQVQASAIDWAFEDQACAPLFAALTVNLTRDNILTEEERRRYAELQKANQVLTGTELAVALRQLNAVDRSSSAAQQSRDIDDMTNTVARLRARLKAEVNRKDKLQQQALASMARVEQLKAMQSEAEQSCHATQQHAASLESRITANRDRITAANTAIRSVASDASVSPLLCLHSLSATAQADAECESRIRSLFLQDHAPSPPSHHADHGDLSLTAGNGTNEPNDVRADYSAELARLRHALATAWTRLADERARFAGLKAAADEAEQQLAQRGVRGADFDRDKFERMYVLCFL